MSPPKGTTIEPLGTRGDPNGPNSEDPRDFSTPYRV